MTSIILLDNQYTDTTRHADPDEMWDADSTSTSHDVYSFEVVGDKHYHDLMVGFDCEYDRDYYLLYALYSSGDSFSNHEGNIEYIGMFEDAELAIKNEKIINDQYRSNKDNYTYNLFDDAGTKYKLCAPWCGYFECLDDVDVVTIRRMED